MQIRTLALAPLALAALLLAGCTAGPSADRDATASPTPDASASASPDDGADGGGEGSGDGDAAGGQTVAEACDVVARAFENLQALNTPEQFETLTTDPAAATELIDTAETTLVTAVGEITNADVRPAADTALEASSQYFDTLRGVAADPANVDVEALTGEVDRFVTGLADLQTACAAG